MAGNEFRGEVDFVLGTHKVRGRFNNSSIACIEKEIGTSIIAAVQGAHPESLLLRVDFLQTAIYEAMHEYGCNAKLNPRRIGQQMGGEPKDLATYADTIMRGLAAWWGKDVDAELAKDPFDDDTKESTGPKEATTPTTPVASTAGGDTSLSQPKTESPPIASGG